jgi:large subunit ribosomal protein L17
MRHNKSFNHLGRKKAHREAMLSNMAVSLITHKRINTTVAKAKALRGFIEPLITRSKVDSTHSRRTVFSMLQDKIAVAELFRDISQKVADRPGGYTRILKTGTRLGDNAEMCMIELVDYNELLLGTKDAKKTSRRRRGKATPKAKEEKTATKKVVAEGSPAEIAQGKAAEVEEIVAESVEETAGTEPVADAEVEPAAETTEEPVAEIAEAQIPEPTAEEQAAEEKPAEADENIENEASEPGPETKA